MSKKDELILKTVKEIVVKFIEVGNISPSSFDIHFPKIYKTVRNTAEPHTDCKEAGNSQESK